MRWEKGSYTLEAAILVPLVLFAVMKVSEIGIGCYMEIVEKAPSEELEKLDIVSEFYNYQILDEVWEEVTDD